MNVQGVNLWMVSNDNDALELVSCEGYDRP